MDACVKSAALSGIDGRVLEVTAFTEPGLPGFEQRGMGWLGRGRRAERVWCAVTACGLPWPGARVTVTVSPDWLPRDERALDLAIAVAVLAADRTVPAYATAGVMCYAGLGADGSLEPVPGALPAALEAARAGCRALVVAAQNVAEARLAAGVTVIGASRLPEVAEWLCSGPTRPRQPKPPQDTGLRRPARALADLNGRERPTRGDCAAALGLRMGEIR
jgi:magnesium chelatase family protein